MSQRIHTDDYDFAYPPVAVFDPRQHVPPFRDGGNNWSERRVLVCAREGSQRVICYPDGFVDPRSNLLYLACDSAQEHYLLKVPLS